MTNEDLIKKYAGKSVKELEREQNELEEEVAFTSKELEQKIQDFSKKVDPLIVNGETLAYVRRPTAKQYERVIPPELAKFRRHPEKISFELARKYENDMYALMEELIVSPKQTDGKPHSAEWWKENTGDEFMAAFQAHIFNVRTKLQEDVQNFLEQT